jgi:hypothetical protein
MDNFGRRTEQIAVEAVERWRDGKGWSHELEMLDTYADCGHPPSVWLMEAVTERVSEMLRDGEDGPLAGRSMSLEESLVSLDLL